MNGANNACPIKRLFFDTSPESKFYWKPPPSQVKFTRYRQRTFRTHACLTLQEASCRGQDQADHNVPITPRSLLLSPSHYIGPDNKRWPGVGSSVGCQCVRLYGQTPHTITQCDTCHEESRDCCHSLITDLMITWVTDCCRLRNRNQVMTPGGQRSPQLSYQGV